MTAGLGEILSSSDEPAQAEGLVDVFAGRIDARWLAASCALSGVGPDVVADYRGILERALETQRAVLFGVGEHAGRVLSVALGSVVEDVVSLSAIATHAEARGRGLATSLLRAILFAASEHDAERALLHVETHNTNARRLYVRLGFEERYRYWYRMGGR